MRLNPIPLLTLSLFLSFSLFAQEGKNYEITLRSGTIIPARNISADSIQSINNSLQKKPGLSLVIIQFEEIPGIENRRLLENAGIRLLDYLPNYAYTATVISDLNVSILQKVRARSIVPLLPAHKLQPALAAGRFPSWAVKQAGMIDVWARFVQTFSWSTVETELVSQGFEVQSSELKQYRILALRIPISRLHELAANPFIEYVQAVPKQEQPLNNRSINNSRANVLKSDQPGARDLSGRGIVIGVGDDANPMLHMDYSSRIINRSEVPAGNHGVHVIGTIAGAGVGDERFEGYAPKAKIIAQYNSKIIAYASVYVQDYGMVLTNNSYGIIEDDCTTFGVYDLASLILDMQASELPSLQNVFAAGNSGLMTCFPYSSGYSTILGSYQSAKNVISVGATTNAGDITSFSSKGPVRDGRIKPEITALGDTVNSTWPTNVYQGMGGTSMAAPAVTGGLALLYERYKQLNGNNNPRNGLMKALLLNGAIDKGNPGPDYSYGFGWMNLLRSVKMLENENYFHDSVANGNTNQHVITVPPNTAELKVMLYWNDPAASPLAGQTLVNDLDLEVRDAGNALSLPFVLDTLPGNVSANATTGVDHINNVEQVVISNPVAGSYTLSVVGTAITQNPGQQYFLVYDTVPVSLDLTYPVGGERYRDIDSIYITWDAFGNPANDFTLEYSTDNSTWTAIATNVPSTQRQYKWYIPDTTSSEVRVRIIQNGTGNMATSGTFIIIGIPGISFASNANQCEGYISVNWTSVPGATDYEVMMLRGDEMVSVGTSTGNNFLISGLSKDSVYWVAVRARLNGVPGRRPRAISRQPNVGSCGNAVFNFDLKADAIISPVSGRQLTSSELDDSHAISVRVKNLDNSNAPAFNIKYSVDGGAFITESSTNLAAQATYVHTFSVPYDFSALGQYQLTVVVENTAAIDPVKANDTIRAVIKHLPNAPVTLSLGNDFIDDFETAADSVYYHGQVGLAGADRYDFYSSSSFGRLRTFVNTGIAYSGVHALTLDSERFNPGGTADSLIGTFNLLPHFNTVEDIRLEFQFKHHGQHVDNPANRVWVRGADTLPWIEAFDLFANQAELPGTFIKSSSIQVSDLLAANGQDFSTSFQIRFGQYGQAITADNESAAGYTFDDVRLYLVENDMEMVSIDTPVVSSCGLDNNVPVEITVRNNADTSITNVPVKYVVDGGATITEIIPGILGNSDFSYTFTSGADLATFGPHIITTWVDYPDDSYRDNDTARVTVINSPIITNFPFLENFESGVNSWYSAGSNNSWAFGTPASSKIDGAASGQNAWKTNLAGSHNGNELSYLYSPCFDVSGMSNPQLSFSLALDLEDCGDADPQDDDNELCDGAYVEYSADGITWTRLGSKNEGTNWYNKAYTNNHLWSVQDYTRWHVATISLPAGLTNLRLRFVLMSDPFINREGIAVDDIHIYDSVYSIYEGSPFTSNEVNEPTVNGTSWIDFTDGGELIASINPNGQDLGSTLAKVFINTGDVRTSSGQYYHDRNITIKPANVNLADSATVRFYFLDSETEALITATGCPGCTKPASAYELGVSKYSDVNDAREDGTIANNIPGGWLFIPPGPVAIVPFAKGYYAEYKVKDFSEFWLNNGGINQNQALPLELMSFNAHKMANNDVLVKWVTANEENLSHFEIEVARGNLDYQQGHFSKINEMPALGNLAGEEHYSYLDNEHGKNGIRYYRLKMVDLDGSHSYSPVRPVMFQNEMKWQVYPNPSTGKFNLVFQHAQGTKINIRVVDAIGKTVLQTSSISSGFIQKQLIDLESGHYSTGLYLLEVNAGDKTEVFRLIRQ